MHWLEIGVDLEYIQMLLGHSDLTTTEICAQISTEKARKVLENTHPAIEIEKRTGSAILDREHRPHVLAGKLSNIVL